MIILFPPIWKLVVFSNILLFNKCFEHVETQPCFDMQVLELPKSSLSSSSMHFNHQIAVFPGGCHSLSAKFNA